MSHEHEPEVVVHPPTLKAAGDPRGKEATWTLMPVTNPDVCSQCATAHEPEEPHNQQSLYWQYAFYAEHERWPTWSDAMAHCTPETQTAWRRELRARGVEI